MGKIERVLMSLIGALAGLLFLGMMFLNGVLGEVTGFPITLQLAFGVTAFSAVVLFFTPVAVLAGGKSGPAKAKKDKPKKEKKDKKSKKADAAASDTGDDFEDADAFESDNFESGEFESGSFESGDFDESMGSEFESDGDEVSESNVADMIDASGVDNDDPFAVTDSFESDVQDDDFDFGGDDSNQFDDELELNPESGIDIEEKR